MNDWRRLPVSSSIRQRPGCRRVDDVRLFDVRHAGRFDDRARPLRLVVRQLATFLVGGSAVSKAVSWIEARSRPVGWRTRRCREARRPEVGCAYGRDRRAPARGRGFHAPTPRRPAPRTVNSCPVPGRRARPSYLRHERAFRDLFQRPESTAGCRFLASCEDHVVSSHGAGRSLVDVVLQIHRHATAAARRDTTRSPHRTSSVLTARSITFTPRCTERSSMRDRTRRPRLGGPRHGWPCSRSSRASGSTSGCGQPCEPYIVGGADRRVGRPVLVASRTQTLMPQCWPPPPSFPFASWPCARRPWLACSDAIASAALLGSAICYSRSGSVLDTNLNAVVQRARAAIARGLRCLACWCGRSCRRNEARRSRVLDGRVSVRCSQSRYWPSSSCCSRRAMPCSQTRAPRLRRVMRSATCSSAAYCVRRARRDCRRGGRCRRARRSDNQRSSVTMLGLAAVVLALFVVSQLLFRAHGRGPSSDRRLWGRRHGRCA